MAVSNLAFQSSGTSADSANAIPNVLAKVAQPAYHWKLGIGNDIGGSDDATIKVILAETGVTGFNISEIEMNALVGLNDQTLNTNNFNFLITIVEPYGMSFPDKLVAAAQKAQVKNLVKAPYLLSLKFQGYDPESGSPTDPIGTEWVWKLDIQRVETHLDTTGSKHTISCQGWNEIAFDNNMQLLQTPITIDVSASQGTVREVMAGIEKEINTSIAKSYNVGNGGIAPFTVKIVDRPYVNSGGSGGAASPFDHKILRSTKYQDSSRNQGKMQISRGTDIPRVIDFLMSVSETATSMINPASSAADTDGESKEYSTMHRVESRVVNVSYNQQTQDYVRELTFTVMGYDSVRPIYSATGQDQAKANGKKKLSFLTANNLLKKEYNYLYTGENTEVLDFNIDLNFDFFVVNNIMDGHLTTENASPGIQWDPDNFNKQTMNTKWQPTGKGVIPLAYCEAPQPNVGGKSVETANTGKSILDSLGSASYAEDLSNFSVFFPTTIVHDGTGTTRQVNQQMEQTNLRTRSIYGGILNQLYNNMDTNLNTAEIVIRGDPYWLGSTNIQPIDTRPSDESAAWASGEHCFLLRFLIPQGFDSEGMPVIGPSNSYSGYYSVRQVTHKFSAGVFTQTLEALRITTIDILSPN